jgi:thiosulfate/3-mercaptopyruvate sulfurtransferase
MIPKSVGLLRLAGVFAIIAVAVAAESGQSDPWSKSELMEPSSLAQIMKSSAAQPTIISVVFPVMYRQRHILHARYGGLASKPEGLDALRQSVEDMQRDSQIVVYYGCCPMEKCPNLRPTYQALKEMGFTQIGNFASSDELPHRLVRRRVSRGMTPWQRFRTMLSISGLSI